MRDNGLDIKNTTMQLFLADCQFPDIENQVKAYQLFELGKMVKLQNQIRQINLRCYLEFMLQERAE